MKYGRFYFVYSVFEPIQLIYWISVISGKGFIKVIFWLDIEWKILEGRAKTKLLWSGGFIKKDENHLSDWE